LNYLLAFLCGTVTIKFIDQVKEDARLMWQERTRYGDKVERRKTFLKGSDESGARVDAADVIYGYKYGSKYLTFTSTLIKELLEKAVDINLLF